MTQTLAGELSSFYQVYLIGYYIVNTKRTVMLIDMPFELEIDMPTEQMNGRGSRSRLQSHMEELPVTESPLLKSEAFVPTNAVEMESHMGSRDARNKSDLFTKRHGNGSSRRTPAACC